MVKTSAVRVRLTPTERKVIRDAARVETQRSGRRVTMSDVIRRGAMREAIRVAKAA